MLNLITDCRSECRLTKTQNCEEHNHFKFAEGGVELHAYNVGNHEAAVKPAASVAIRAAALPLTDLLASYELRPGTVAFVGYGSLHEKRDFVDEQWVPGGGDYLTTRRGFFLKASYLYRF